MFLHIAKLLVILIFILEVFSQYDDKNNIWEQSGKFEGDMVIDVEKNRNGLLNKTRRWSNGIVPYEIEKDDFSKEETDVIKDAIEEYHSKTCIKFKNRDDTDDAWITFRSNDTGCFSAVGKNGGGQIINLSNHEENGTCVQKGVIIHEILHALGFYHQQSSTERDDYVTIVWANIDKNKTFNFWKYNASTVTNFGFEYDYQSIMHYSGTAFSINGKDTIIAKKKNTTLGNKLNFSDTDLLKLKEMYKDECNKREKSMTKGVFNSLWSILLNYV